jgi:RNA polymerase sigma-70 factor (ECF subfamily)
MARPEHENTSGAKPFTAQSAASPSGGPADLVGTPSEHTLSRIRLCLEELDEPGRNLLRLKINEGLSYQQLSERTGLSVGTIGHILHQALQRVATELEKAGIGL